jgi:hypothetical protein
VISAASKVSFSAWSALRSSSLARSVLRDLRVGTSKLNRFSDISMVAGEAKNPRKTMPRAFTSIIYRLVAFFILGSLAVGIVVCVTH